MFIEDVNLQGYTSKLINTIKSINETDNMRLSYYDSEILDDFNNRIVTPSNINRMISFCDYLLLENTLYFLVNESIPTEEPYILDKYNKMHHTLPLFMTKLQSVYIVNHTINCPNLINWLRYCYSITNTIERNTVPYAIKLGNFECVKYGIENDIHNNTWIYYYELAAIYNRIDVLDYGVSNNFELDFNVGIIAVKKGHMDFCKALIKYKYEFTKDIIDTALESGDMEMVLFLHNYGYKLSSVSLIFAAKSGNIDCIKYVHTHGGSKCVLECNYAAGTGSVECLQYLHEIGCSWNKWTSCNAVKHGHLDCLQYLHKHNCPITPEVYAYATKYGHTNCVNYLIDNNLIGTKA